MVVAYLHSQTASAIGAPRGISRRWRKLKHRIGLAPSAPLDAPNAVLLGTQLGNR